MVVAATKQTGARTYLWVSIACNRPVWTEGKWTGWDLNHNPVRCLIRNRLIIDDPDSGRGFGGRPRRRVGHRLKRIRNKPSSRRRYSDRRAGLRVDKMRSL